MVVGILLGGVGVVPIAMLSAVFHGAWGALGSIVLGVVLTYGWRVVSAILEAQAKQRTERLAFLSEA